MKQLKTVFSFEFLGYAKRKSFIGLTLVMILIVAGVLSWGRISEIFKQPAGPEEPGTPAPAAKVALLDDAEGAAGDAAFYNAAYANQGFEFVAVNLTKQEAEQAVTNNEYDSAIVLTGPLTYTRIVRTLGLYDEFAQRFNETMLYHYRAAALQDHGVDQTQAQALLGAAVKGDVRFTAEGKSQEQSFIYTYVLIFMLYFAIMMYGQFVSASVATEKSTRAMELLITSSRPTSLMFGKVLGTGFAGFVQMVLILGSAFVFYHFNKGYYTDSYVINSLFSMPVSILLYTVLFFILGFFLYAFLYASLASLVSRMEELGTAVMPVTMLFILAFVVSMISMGSGNVDSLLMRVCSYVPFTSPMVMFARIAMGEVMPLEIIASVAILFLSTVVVGVLAAKIYRLGVLMYGTPPKPSNIIKMLRNKS
ncbi:MAG: ABC transporter permease [Oscillospiraceae bacterium]|jgi:ABC-2 type transport system permease protein|nr:ABC transporter permease [Oscillospiraceae bacterium]